MEIAPHRWRKRKWRFDSSVTDLPEVPEQTQSPLRFEEVAGEVLTSTHHIRAQSLTAAYSDDFDSYNLLQYSILANVQEYLCPTGHTSLLPAQILSA